MLDCCQAFERIEHRFYAGFESEEDFFDAMADMGLEDWGKWINLQERRSAMDRGMIALQYDQERDRKRLARDAERAKRYQQHGGKTDGPDSGEQAGHQAAAEASDSAGEAESEELRGGAESEPGVSEGV